MFNLFALLDPTKRTIAYCYFSVILVEPPKKMFSDISLIQLSLLKRPNLFKVHLIGLVVPDFVGFRIRSGLSVVLDQKLVGSSQLGSLRVGGRPDGGVEDAEEPDDQSDDAFGVELK